MAIEPVVIADNDWETWGKLVKSWATRENRINPGGPPDEYPVPESLDAMKEQMTRAGMKGFVIPPRIKAVHFVWYNAETLVLKLPNKELIKASEAALGGGAPYPLPAFYDDIYGKAHNIPQQDKQKRNDQRVGDYTIRACA
jgi:hypothetical protein